jgi:hypothetical protein
LSHHARVDVANWKNFLKSDLGGAWKDSEIVSFSKPNSGEVETALKVESDCYTFVAFSGHGSEGSVVLNEHWIKNGYSIASLKPKGDKGTLIIDSCRGVSVMENMSFGNKIAAINESQGLVTASAALRGRATEFANATTILNRAEQVQKHHAIWCADLTCCSNGIVEMLACAKGQAAQEDPTAGGYYTSLLLQSAELWQQSSTFAKVHSTKNAHDYAASMLPPKQQAPEYRPLSLKFPFAVKV